MSPEPNIAVVTVLRRCHAASSWAACSAGSPSSVAASATLLPIASPRAASPTPPRMVTLRPNRSRLWMPCVPSWMWLSRLSR